MHAGDAESSRLPGFCAERFVFWTAVCNQAVPRVPRVLRYLLDRGAMLQSVMIVTGSGLVAFNQSFSAKPLVAAIGGLLKSVAALGQIATGLPLQVLEYERAIVVLSARTTTVASSSALCAVIIDRGSGQTPVGAVLFGKTLATHLLTIFWDCYGRELTEGGGAHIVGRFKAFGARIPDLAADAARVLLRQCELGGRADRASTC